MLLDQRLSLTEQLLSTIGSIGGLCSGHQGGGPVPNDKALADDCLGTCMWCKLDATLDIAVFQSLITCVDEARLCQSQAAKGHCCNCRMLACSIQQCQQQTSCEGQHQLCHS